MSRRLLAPLATLGAAIACALAPSAAQAAAAPLPSRGTVHGTVVSTGWSTLTVRTHVRKLGVMAALTAAADRVAAGQYPYVWGGGHAAAGAADTGMRGGPGHDGRRIGYDCSGTVAAVLSGAGLWAPGTGVPSDAGIVSQLRRAGLVVGGAGHGRGSVTLWDRRGSHIFIQLGERFFGTSDGGAPPVDNPRGGAGWLDDGAPDTGLRSFHPFHFVAPALRGRVDYGPTVTVALRAPLADTAAELAPGTRVRMSYRTVHHALVATSVS